MVYEKDASHFHNKDVTFKLKSKHENDSRKNHVANSIKFNSHHSVGSNLI